jgi:ribose transport system permease protein
MATTSTSDIGKLVSDRLGGFSEIALLVGAIVLLSGIFTAASPVFFSIGNILNIIRQTAIVIILGLGMTYVIISAEIDVSIGGVMALSAVSAGLVINAVGPFAGAVVGLLVGLGFGLANGLVTIRFGIPSFIVTIGTLGIARGAAFIVSQQRPVIVRNAAFESVFGGTIGPVPVLILWALGLSIVAGIALWRTRFGRHVYATGDSEQAARYSGISTDRVKITTLALAGLTAGMAGLLFIGRLGAARADMASGIELAVIAAVIIGGTSLFGGRGSIVGAILGALLISVIDNGLTLLGFGSSWQQLIRGVVIIAAVALRDRDEEESFL